MSKYTRTKIFFIVLFLFALLAADGLGALNFVKGMVLRVAQPPVTVVTTTLFKFKNIVVSLAILQNQIQERAELERRVKLLFAENASLTQEREENKELREMLGLKSRLPFTIIAASVVSKDPSGLTGSIVINKGKDAGISSDDAVVDIFGNLLGIVKEVFDHSSKFLLLTDGSAKIDAHVPGKKALGIISGSHRLGLSFDLVSQEAVLGKEDLVVTSGLTGRLPEGILIGTIEKQQSSNSELFQKFSLTPAADFKNFYFVSVITDF